MAPPRSPDERGSVLAGPGIGTGRAVEVLHDRGPSAPVDKGQWTAGSGYLIGGRLVLTAAHNVDCRRDLGDDEQLLVRRIDGSELAARVMLVCDESSKVDLALLEIIDPDFDDIRPPVTVARVNRDSAAPVADCWAVGFPRFGEAGPVLPGGSRKDTWEVSGHILPGGKLRAGLFSFQVTSTPRSLPASLAGSEWEGMSGAVVFATDSHDGALAVGVVTAHHRPEGESALAVVPITAAAGVPTAAQWWRQLGVPDPDALPVLPRQHSPVATMPLAEYGQLVDFRLNADGLVAGLDLPHFTGREWLREIIDDFLHSEDRGYFVLEAGAGLGKTTFCAWLARSRRYPVHFVGIPGGADPAAALRNLAAQLIDICQLDEVAPGGMLPPTAGSPNGFVRLLAAAAVRARQADGPLVLVVDGLDDGPHQVGEMPLGLPASPPPNVYLVVSRRPGDQMLPVDAPRRYFTLQAQAEPNQPPVPNQQDMLVYLRQAADEPSLADLLAAASVPADVFVSQLAAKCAGVWIYLRYVLEEIRRRRRPLADLDTLPENIWQYYARTFDPSRQEDPDRWQAVLLPLLAALGAVREPVTFGLLCTLAGVQADERWRMVLDGPWRPFLRVQDDSLDTEPRYSVYHDSLRDFLDGRLGEEALAQMTAERPLIRQLHRALRDRHSLIADRYLSAWGGLDCGLPDLEAAPELGQRDGGYALRWLTWHLLKADREADLHRLLACGPDRENIWFTAHDTIGDVSGYLRDVVQTRGTAPQRLGTQLRYALVEASIASLSTTLPAGVIEQLVSRGLWFASRAFSFIERMADKQRQAQGLARIAAHLPGELLDPALSVATRCQEQDRATVLQALIPRLDRLLLERAADAVLGIDNKDIMLVPMVEIAARLPKHSLSSWPPAALWNRSNYVRAAVALFGTDDRSEGARRALAEALEVSIQPGRGLLVAALLPYFPGEVFDEVLAVLQTMSKSHYLDAPLLALAEHAPVERLGDVLDFALGRWCPVPDFFRRIAPRLTSEHLSAAVQLCQHGRRDEDKAESFAALASLLDADQARRLLAPTETTTGLFDRRAIIRQRVIFEKLGLVYASEEARLIVVSALLGRLPKQEARQEVSDQIIPDLLWQTERYNRFNFLLLARYLPPDMRPTAMAFIYEGLIGPWNVPEEHAAFLPRFARLSDEELAGVFDAAQANSRSDARLMVADVLAPHLPDNQLRYALTRVMAFPLEEECFTALAQLGRYQPPEHRDKIGKRGLDMANSITHIKSRTRAVIALAPIISPELANKAFGILWSVDPYWGVRAMEAIADVLPLERLRDVPDRIRGSRDPDPALDIPKILKRLSDGGQGTIIDSLIPRPTGSWHSSQSERISSLAPILSPTQARRAWHVGEPEGFGFPGAEALSALAGRLPESERATAVDEVLAAYTLGSHSAENEAQILGQLARAAPTERLTQVLREFLSRNRGLRYKALEELAPVLPEILSEEAFHYALSDDWMCCPALAKLAPRLSGSLLKQAISHVTERRDYPGAAAALTALARQLPEDHKDREAVLSLALDTAMSRPDGSAEHGVMADLIPQLPERLRPKAAKAATDEACSGLRFHRTSREKELDRLRAVLAVLRGPELDQFYARLEQEVLVPQVRARAQAAVILRAAGEHAAGFLADERPVYHDWPEDLDRARIADLIGASASSIYEKGDGTAVDEVIEAIFDVTRWWP